ncbi:MAG: sortase [Methanobacteriaceae archaeon]|jgi:sortase A|nr:MAG: sortase [Methanobacterium sp. BRmetb2]MCC7557475.1 sortase [Methanobacteriaceae archaeon]
MLKYKIVAVFLILISIVFAFNIALIAFEGFENLNKAKNKVEAYKSTPVDLLDPNMNSDFSSSSSSYKLQLIIPKINVKCKIRSDTVNAYDSVYHYTESVLPGQDGECGLLGHRTTYSGPFRQLGSLRSGDKVIIIDPILSEKYTYQVVSNGKDIRWDYKENPIQFEQRGEPRLLLVTCYPPGRKQAAWITHCKLVSTTPLN